MDCLFIRGDTLLIWFSEMKNSDYSRRCLFCLYCWGFALTLGGGCSPPANRQGQLENHHLSIGDTSSFMVGFSSLSSYFSGVKVWNKSFGTSLQHNLP